MRHFCRISKAPLAACLLALGACSADTGPLIANRGGDFTAAVPTDNPFSVITAKDEGTFAGDQLRNYKILRVMAIEDESFRTYILKIWNIDATTVTGLDLANLGLTAASSLTGGALAKALAAAATAATGARTSIDKNFFYGKTIDALLYSMVATRARIRSHIQTCLKLSVDSYDLPTALYDVEQYRDAGRLQSAIASIAVASSGAVTSAEPECTNKSATSPPPARLMVAAPPAPAPAPAPAARVPQRIPGVTGAPEAARLQAFVDAGGTRFERGRRLDLIMRTAIEAGFPDTKSGDRVIEDTGPAADDRRRRVLEMLSVTQ